MKHILNNLSEEEKNNIRKQHTGGMKVMTENFNKLLNSKLGDAKPLNEETNDSMPNSKIISTLNALGFEKKFCNKSSRGQYGNAEKDSNYCNQENPEADILITYKSPYNSVVIMDVENLNKEVIDNVTPSEIETTLRRAKIKVWFLRRLQNNRDKKKSESGSSVEGTQVDTSKMLDQELEVLESKKILLRAQYEEVCAIYRDANIHSRRDEMDGAHISLRPLELDFRSTGIDFHTSELVGNR
jgi:hypothetical protein